jgi:hypothetical protein
MKICLKEFKRNTRLDEQFMFSRITEKFTNDDIKLSEEFNCGESFLFKRIYEKGTF